jgi:alpha-glucosidase (family GH31 glycosyl hydrolase)
MTAEATREPALALRHPWFLDLYATLLRDPSAATPEIATRLTTVDPTDPIEAALTLYLAALSAQSPAEVLASPSPSRGGDRGGGTLPAPALVSSPEAKSLRTLITARLTRELTPNQNHVTDTWVVALWAAALREANHLVRDEATTRLVGRVKNHVYANHVRAGGLMSSSDKSTLDFDVLLAAVPFGLFDCEDLVLVDAVRTLTTPDRLAAATTADRLLLALYYAQQGSYSRSRALLAEVHDLPVDFRGLSTAVSHTLRALGQLETRFIRHAPDGNGNRYEPLTEERFPKLVTDTDEVIVRAVASPLSADEPLELLLGDTVLPGIFKGDRWEFTLPRTPSGSLVEYRIRFKHHSSVVQGPFIYEVLTRIRNVGSADLFGPRVELRPDASAGSFSPIRLGTATLTEVSWLHDRAGKIREISATLTHPPCGWYGFGERYNALNQAGNLVDQFVYNQYKEQGLRTYMPMPVGYTDAGFGLHLATDSYSWFDLSTPGETRFGVEADHLAIDLFTGTIAKQISQFMAATGDPEPVPAWALGPWMSSNNWDSEAEVRKQVALTLEHEIPATVLVIEAWSDEATFYIFNDAQYLEKPGAEAFAYSDFSFPEWGRWPDPKGLTEHLHDNDLRLILWQIPIIKQSPALKHAQKRNDESHFFAEGYGVHRPDGTPIRLPEGWFKDSLLMDFTNPAGRDWWFSKRQYLIDELGVDGFKTDGGEMVWGRDLVFADGRTGLENRNAYPRDYISAYYRFAQQNGGICFSRAGYTGAQTFPAHWAGDERSTWEAFKRSIHAGLSAGMSGVIFWGWDLGGFSGEVPSPELYVRSAAMACFCPIMQYHAESKAEFNQDRTPWNIADRSGDQRALTGYRFYANLRMSLMPYLQQEAAWCIAQKQPLMRAMLLDYQEDSRVIPLWDQYMFGRDLLVAPVIREGETSREVTLPAGRWWHLFENRWYEAGTHQVSAELEQIPVFLRQGATLPLAFHREARLGATMPSDLAAPEISVLLIAGLNAPIHHDGLEIELTGDLVRVTSHRTRPIKLVFTDPPAHLELNGIAQHPATIDLSGADLTMFDLI